MFVYNDDNYTVWTQLLTGKRVRINEHICPIVVCYMSLINSEFNITEPIVVRYMSLINSEFSRPFVS